MKLSKEQRKVLSEAMANIGVAWFAGGVVAPFFTTSKLSEVVTTVVWGFMLATVSIGMALQVMGRR